MAIYDVSTNEKKASPSLVAGGTLYADSPVGSILPFGGSNPPSGFLLCQGQEVSKTTYAELYAVIGDSFGTASDATKFVIPDMRESVPKGAGLTGKTVGAHVKSGGLAIGEFLDDRIQDHRHVLPLGTAVGGDAVMLAQNTLTDNTGVVENDYRKGATTEVKSVGVNYIIKAKMIGVPADFMSAVKEAVEEKATRFPDYAHPIAIPSETTTWTATEDCYVVAYYFTASGIDVALSRRLTIDGNTVGIVDSSAGTMSMAIFNGYVKKGQIVSSVGDVFDLGNSQAIKFFPLS